MNAFAFLLYNFIGTIVWCGVLAYAGMQLGAHFKDVHKYLAPAGYLVLAALLIWGGVTIWKRHKGRGAEKGKSKTRATKR